MFLVVPVCSQGGAHVTITHDAFELTAQAPHPCSLTWDLMDLTPPDMGPQGPPWGWHLVAVKVDMASTSGQYASYCNACNAFLLCNVHCLGRSSLSQNKYQIFFRLTCFNNNGSNYGCISQNEITACISKQTVWNFCSAQESCALNNSQLTGDDSLWCGNNTVLGISFYCQHGNFSFLSSYFTQICHRRWKEANKNLMINPILDLKLKLENDPSYGRVLIVIYFVAFIFVSCLWLSQTGTQTDTPMHFLTCVWWTTC